MELNGRAALVSGGASGLGGATARELVARGGRVAVLDRDGEKAQALAEELGDGAAAFEADVTDEAQVQAAVDGAVEAFGELRLVVGCAGIGWAEKTVGKQGAANLQPFETVVRVNLIGMYNVLRLGAAAMNTNDPDEHGERGCVVMTASIAAWDGQIGQTAYSASKGGVAALTLPAARDLAGRGIRVNTIAPGPVRHAAPRRTSPGAARRARQGHPVPAAARRPARVRAARLPHRREPDAERRDDPAGRRAPNAAPLTVRAAVIPEVGAVPELVERIRRAPGRAGRRRHGGAAQPGGPLDGGRALLRRAAQRSVRARHRGRRTHRGRHARLVRDRRGVHRRRLDGRAGARCAGAHGRAARRRGRRRRGCSASPASPPGCRWRTGRVSRSARRCWSSARPAWSARSPCRRRSCSAGEGDRGRPQRRAARELDADAHVSCPQPPTSSARRRAAPSTW